MRLALVYFIALCVARQTHGLAIRQYPEADLDLNEDTGTPTPTPTPTPAPKPTPTPQQEAAAPSTPKSSPTSAARSSAPNTSASHTEANTSSEDNAAVDNAAVDNAAVDNARLPYPEDSVDDAGNNSIMTTDPDGDAHNSASGNSDDKNNPSATDSDDDLNANNASDYSELDNSELNNAESLNGAESDFSSDQESGAGMVKTGKSNKALQVGMGIGITAALLIILGLLMFFFVRYKRQARRKMHEEIADISGAGEQPDAARNTFAQLLVPDSAHPDSEQRESYQINLVLHDPPTDYLSKPSADPKLAAEMPPQYHELPENRYAQDKNKED